MRIGVYGGAFDPAHSGHLIIAGGVLEELDLDRVLFIPYTTGPHRPAGPVASAGHRLEMLRLCLGENPEFEIDDREIRRGGISYMIDTLRSLRSDHPDAEFFLIVGSDQLKIFAKWKGWRTILELAVVAVIERPGHSLTDGPEELLQIMVTISIPPQSLSSTLVRDRIEGGDDIRQLVPEPVVRYIQEHGLYGFPRHEPSKD
ncbi:nicotinate-nucleotide adenylyltransferase [Gemmatimonadota bacterium]